MGDKTLRKAIIRLAHKRPELRSHLLPLLLKQARTLPMYLWDDGGKLVLWSETPWVPNNPSWMKKDYNRAKTQLNQVATQLRAWAYEQDWNAQKSKLMSEVQSEGRKDLIRYAINIYGGDWENLPLEMTQLPGRVKGWKKPQFRLPTSTNPPFFGAGQSSTRRSPGSGDRTVRYD